MRARLVLLIVGLALLALVPPGAAYFDQPFYVDLLRRVMIFAIAALSLNLIVLKNIIVIQIDIRRWWKNNFRHIFQLGIVSIS